MLDTGISVVFFMLHRKLFENNNNHSNKKKYFHNIIKVIKTQNNANNTKSYKWKYNEISQIFVKQKMNLLRIVDIIIHLETVA